MKNKMKIILSRKGFDSGYGGYPSPILPDGRLISLPIPSSGDKTKYNELNIKPFGTYYTLMLKLCTTIKNGNTRDSLTAGTQCHLDPDIYKDVIKRPAQWKGCFGQIGAAQCHLSNQDVSEDDIFLFFGWFRRTKYDDTGKLMSDRTDRAGIHLIYGFLEVGEIIRTRYDSVPQWLKQHPHVLDKGRFRDKSNTIYISKDTCSFNKKIPGYGFFRFNQDLILTKKGMPKSCWNLRKCFKNISISYHGANSKYGWRGAYFQSAAKGQEFVIDANDEILTWTKKLIEQSI